MLPPEVNSTRMYSGPGAGSLWAAAAAWDQVSAELQSAAETYRSVIASLTGWQWLGPSSVRMGAAVTPYVEWLTTTAAQARQTATQITAAATGFEQAFAMTVPPPAIMANRAQVLSLIATNFFGQNTAAIAALETQYAEMWEQDATAMYDYAATSAAARTLTPFTSPQQDTNSAGLPAQSAEVSRATANAGAADGNWLGNLLEEIGITAAADRARADTLFPGGGRNRQCDTFPEHRRGRVLFARRPTGLVRNDRLDQQHQFDGYRHHWGREEFGDLARARERGCGGRSPTSRHRPGVPRAADQHGQVTIGRSTTRPGRSFGRDARRGYHRANVGAARLEGARGHHRQGVRCHPNDHTARRRRPRRWSAWTARDASLGGRTGWRGAPIRRTADRDDTSTLGRVTSVRDGGAP